MTTLVAKGDLHSPPTPKCLRPDHNRGNDDSSTLPPVTHSPLSPLFIDQSRAEHDPASEAAAFSTFHKLLKKNEIK